MYHIFNTPSLATGSPLILSSLWGAPESNFVELKAGIKLNNGHHFWKDDAERQIKMFPR
jgi:hypothetical protein